MTVLAVETLSAEPVPVTVSDGAVHELMAAGQMERIHSIRLGPRYRAMRQRQAGAVSAR